MNYWRAAQHIERSREGGDSAVDFIAPVVSAMLAAETIHGNSGFTLNNECQAYADMVGLTDVLAGSALPEDRSGWKRGLTYSPLARLAAHDDVDAATDTVTSCLDAQLKAEHPDLVAEIARVIGELHDNVASHARGAGYSALQVYQSPARVEFAVVDAGRGLLRSIGGTAPKVTRDVDAITWCFKRGTTTARPIANMAQRLDPDGFNPYPRSVQTVSNENNHQGEGLWQLLQVVRSLGGELWVLTGEGQMQYRNGCPTYTMPRVAWGGLAIEVALPIRSGVEHASSEEDESVARRYGL